LKVVRVVVSICLFRQVNVGQRTQGGTFIYTRVREERRVEIEERIEAREDKRIISRL